MRLRSTRSIVREQRDHKQDRSSHLVRTWTGGCFGHHHIDHCVATREDAWRLANDMYSAGRTVEVRETIQ